jgi:pimeloyl-ACP methyl ester carboxylesterase
MKENNFMSGQYIESNGIRLHVFQDGDAGGDLVILLHGFPEFSFGWRKQMPALSQAGYRVWAPDQRGYNLSDKPSGIAAYKIDILAADIVGLIDAAGVEKAIIVGHDWGAAVAWWLATQYPERVSKLVVMNVPHPLVMLKHVRSSFRQMLRSWYIGFFQLPFIPEFLISMGNWNGAVDMLKRSSQAETFSESDLARYREAWSQPKAFHSMINWYRAFVRNPPTLTENTRITVPTLLIWGKQDIALGEEMAQPSIDLCDNGELVFIEEASHWVQHEAAEQVNELMLAFLGGGNAA